MKSDETTDQPDRMKCIMPVIRNLSPKMIAEDIVGVQPMTGLKSMQIGFTDGIEHPYWVEVPWNPGAIWAIKNTHSTMGRSDKYIESKAWCEETFPMDDWIASSFKFYFRNEKDRDWFVLRWS